MNYWLKTQLEMVSSTHEQSFQHEIACYQRFAQHALDITVPFQILKAQDVQLDCHVSEFDLNSSVDAQYLLMQDTAGLFAHPPQYYTLCELRAILLGSLNLIEQMYEHGYLHADLKTDHFRVDKVGKPKLIDFEQCIALGENTPYINTATPRYMAPELFHAEVKSIHSELYALGIIWLEWLSQIRIKHSTYYAWAKWHCQELEVNLPETYKCFEAVLVGLLAKQKSQRCTNFYQIKQLLSNIV